MKNGEPRRVSTTRRGRRVHGVHELDRWRITMTLADQTPLRIENVRLEALEGATVPDRQIPFASLAREHLAFIHGASENHASPMGRGRRHPDLLLIETAADYLTAVSSGDRKAVQTLATRAGVTGAAIRTRLLTARQRGYLTSPGKGRVGGELSPAALAVLNESTVADGGTHG
jgi:hypothetical protein